MLEVGSKTSGLAFLAEEGSWPQVLKTARQLSMMIGLEACNDVLGTDCSDHVASVPDEPNRAF